MMMSFFLRLTFLCSRQVEHGERCESLQVSTRLHNGYLRASPPGGESDELDFSLGCFYPQGPSRRVSRLPQTRQMEDRDTFLIEATSRAGRQEQSPPVGLFAPSNNPDYQTHKVSEEEVAEANSREGSFGTLMTG